MTRILDIVHLCLKLLLGTLVGGLIIPVSMQVLSRYTGLIPRYIWTEEIARFCFIWMVMVGAMCAARDGTHFDLDLLPRSSNPKVEAAKRIFVHLMMLDRGRHLHLVRLGHDRVRLVPDIGDLRACR